MGAQLGKLIPAACKPKPPPPPPPIEEPEPEPEPETATFAAGCFWGLEKFFRKEFGPSLLLIKVGYTGGETDDPDFVSVCSGTTGHAQAMQLVFYPGKVAYKELVTYFFRIHKPTILNRHVDDVGTQFRSAIFYHSDEQKQVAEEVKEEIQLRYTRPIVTEIVEATTFYDADRLHQAYHEKNIGGYCNHRLLW